MSNTIVILYILDTYDFLGSDVKEPHSIVSPLSISLKCCRPICASPVSTQWLYACPSSSILCFVSNPLDCSRALLKAAAAVGERLWV